MEQLIPVINKLQDVFAAIGQSVIDLPQVRERSVTRHRWTTVDVACWFRPSVHLFAPLVSVSLTGCSPLLSSPRYTS